ncbi:FAS1-like dehydratase domain-containing protein [Marinobacter sp. SS21]|uniref:FAS1-like dehydratase domain-containing protein n=1 Tax=Marinobacter sp. SS21 TaxID=2979460 RepID=UPI00232D63DF|nr:MaoC family dehydratase N-terminal domain-containing protein [Marinobacter sp. SS21]MDC0662959.1 MaoC family dehydratase N-terminal domain-containing protein [Marinobacter sp. SS21]
MSIREQPLETRLDHLQQWVGKTRVLTDTVSAGLVAKLAAVLDHDRGASRRDGQALPWPWHWLCFTPTPQASETGADGHPRTGDFLPPVPLPRRMWAGSQLSCQAPLTVGDRLRCESRVASVTPKQGRQGALVFVTVEHRIYTSRHELAVTETQDIVYRNLPTGPAPVAPVHQPELSAQWHRTVRPDPVMLFRYSALTYNGHRIHYDRDWAVQQEGYPGLVVHGPLTATLLLDLMYRQLGSVAINVIRFRGVNPLFDTEAFSLHGRRDGDTVSLWALTAGRQLAMSMEVTLAPVADQGGRS